MLTIFIAIPLRSGLWRRAAALAAMWLALVLAIIGGMTYLAPEHMERAIPGGFELHGKLVAWAFGASPTPASLRTDPSAHAIELAGVVFGSLLTAGLAGNWFLMRVVNESGFSMGIVWRAVGGPGGLLLAIPVWSLLRIAGLAGFVLLFAQPLLSGQWSPRYYWVAQRRLIIWSVLLFALGLLLGLVVPPLWQSMMDAVVQ